jgi:hypothetical protein
VGFSDWWFLTGATKREREGEREKEIEREKWKERVLGWVETGCLAATEGRLSANLCLLAIALL